MSKGASNPTDSPLAGWIRERIATGGPVTFAQFMEWALYHPEHGYYSKGPAIGPRGDFTTSPEASPAFGRLLARHVADVDALLGSPSPFDLVEAGPGLGTLAADLLDELSRLQPALLTRLRYWLVERSQGLAAHQQALLLPTYQGTCLWAEGLDSLPVGLTGELLANEVVDAFPVHILQNVEGQIREHFVGVNGEVFAAVYGPPSDSALPAFLEQHRIVLEPGERIEINLAAERWLAQIARLYRSCIATLIDYGDTAPARYSPARREGTLLGYFGGAVTDNLLARPGMQDLTALVDFTALTDAARATGFSVIGMTRQANFLLGLGLGTSITAEEPGASLEQTLANRRGIQALVSPEGLGRFHVLLLGKGVDADKASEALSGLKYADV